MANGGSPRVLSYAGRIFPFMGDAEPKRKLGGYENEINPTGDGQNAVSVGSIVSPQVTGCKIMIDDERGDQVFLQEKANGGKFEDFSYDRKDGSTWGCKMQIDGAIEFDDKTSTAEISFKGVGTLERQ